jgi:hypothetical protein
MKDFLKIEMFESELKMRKNEKLFFKLLFITKFTTNNIMKNKENIKKKVKIMLKFKKRRGCTRKIRISNFPSLPPIIFNKKSIRDKNKTKNIIRTLKKINEYKCSKKNKKYSKTFKITAIK